jgi:cysteine synthase
MGLIIAILIAMAIPTFLGARTRAQDRAAQSNLRNALTAEKSYYTNGQAYTAVTASLKAIEPSLTYNADAAPTAVNQIDVDAATAGTVTLGTLSGLGHLLLHQGRRHRVQRRDVLRQGHRLWQAEHRRALGDRRELVGRQAGSAQGDPGTARVPLP